MNPPCGGFNHTSHMRVQLPKALVLTWAVSVIFICLGGLFYYQNYERGQNYKAYFGIYSQVGRRFPITKFVDRSGKVTDTIDFSKSPLTCKIRLN